MDKLFDELLEVKHLKLDNGMIAHIILSNSNNLEKFVSHQIDRYPIKMYLMVKQSITFLMIHNETILSEIYIRDHMISVYTYHKYYCINYSMGVNRSLKAKISEIPTLADFLPKQIKSANK